MGQTIVRACMGVLLGLGAAINAGCPSPTPTVDTVTIQYVNSTSAQILVDLLTSSDPNISQDALLADGNLLRDTVDPSPPPLEFTLACQDAQAIIIDRAVMLITDGPEIGSVILYQGIDFFCGDVASFEFTTNADQTELAVGFLAF